MKLRKLSCKYPGADLAELVTLLQRGLYHTLPLQDSGGQPLVYLEQTAQVRLSAAKLLLTPQRGPAPYGLQAMEDEIISSLRIEQIDTRRESVRRVLAGYAPVDESENRIYGMKRGLEFIADPANRINEANFHTLYQTAIGEYLPKENQLPPGSLYRQDAVYVVGSKLEHTGLAWQKLPEYMAALFAFARQDTGMNELLKAAALHFYLAWLHPYFDGNGRMARLLHLWYLVQQGYPSALFVPLSSHIEKSRRQYYNAYSLIERNCSVSGMLDITPFLIYFADAVYHQLGDALPPAKTTASFEQALAQGRVTEKEKDLWQFVLSAYGTRGFSTKQLERDFGHAAYATIRGFVLKFTDLGLLTAVRYGSRVKYHLTV